MIPTVVQEKVGNVKVVCRFRPINEKEIQNGGYQINDILDDKTVSIKQPKHDKNTEPLQFSFDKVFDQQTTQQELFKYAAAPVIDSVIEGFNGTIFAYGQTASGKTHTMQGQIGKQIVKQSGIIPRMVRRLFSTIQQSSQHVEFRIKISLVQLYMEKLRDLLDQGKPDLKIRSDKKKGIFIQDLTETYISSPQQVYQLMQIARRHRVIASTNMNERSSRSHMLFILTVSQNNTDDLSAKTGKLYLVDLAGSEKVGKTGAQGKLLDQAKKINVSLTALGKVINSLTDGKSTHVPYRDSKLTRVLQQSLGGNSKTSLIVTCSPHSNNMAQTISTLRFGISAKKIKNKPKINKQLTVPQLQNLLQKAQKQILQKNNYIQQIKNYVMVDLKQKSIPIFSHQKTSVIRNQQTQLATQLQRQLQMERSMHLVQQQQMAALKKRFEQLIAQKQIIEKENEDLRMQNNQPIIIKKQISIDGDSSQQHDSISELPSEYAQLLSRYQNQKQKRLKAQQKNSLQQKRMCKKLIQLQNNLSQLTHAYYDLLIIQQRYKVDNIFLRKRIQQKDLTIISLKKKIKDLQDQNRQLQDQRWNDQENKDIPQSKYGISSEQQQKFEKLLQKNLSSIPGSKVVKVLKGGNR